MVNEVTRGITERDAYEKVSRDIRYGFYTEVINAALTGEFDEDHPGECVEYRVSGVIFGHHLGDVQENIISNVMR